MTVKGKKKVVKYKAVDSERFALMYNNSVPEYKELCSGKSVSLNEKNKVVKDWINNNIIVKE